MLTSRHLARLILNCFSFLTWKLEFIAIYWAPWISTITLGTSEIQKTWSALQEYWQNGVKILGSHSPTFACGSIYWRDELGAEVGFRLTSVLSLVIQAEFIIVVLLGCAWQKDQRENYGSMLSHVQWFLWSQILPFSQIINFFQKSPFYRFIKYDLSENNKIRNFYKYDL